MRTVSQWQRGVVRAVAAAAFVALVGMVPTGAQAQCVGDCSADGEVTVDEIITMVNISLETSPVSACPIGDSNHDGAITVDEIIQAVNAALNGCEPPPGGCGDGVVQTGEDCDDGGICIGGSNAGTACTAESQCQGNGVCSDGNKVGTSCASNSDCPGATCVHCKTNGGDGCAANCTSETTATYNLIPGVVMGLDIKAGTSGAVVHGDPLTIPLPITGTQNIVIGKAKDGIVPFVIPAASVQFPQIPVSTLACACVRGVEFKTCGGTVFNADGSITPSCTDGFNGAITCPSDKPCAFVHGPGISATGTLGCGASGLSGVNVSLEQNAMGEPGVPAGPVVVAISGSGPSGSARLLNSTAIGTAVGRCQAGFCTNSDPASARGTPQTLPFTTGQACATIKEANDDPTFDIGPFCTSGSPVNCSNLTSTPPVLTGFAIVGAFPAADQNTVGDIVVTTQFIAQ